MKKTKKPSPHNVDAAAQLLAVPIVIGEMAKQLNAQTVMLNQMDMVLKYLAQKLGVEVVTPPLPPDFSGVFFLNEAHTTHLTKAQARKEREEYRKNNPPKGAKNGHQRRRKTR